MAASGCARSASLAICALVRRLAERETQLRWGALGGAEELKPGRRERPKVKRGDSDERTLARFFSPRIVTSRLENGLPLALLLPSPPAVHV